MLGTGAGTELLNPAEAPADFEAPFSGWAEIFAELSGRHLTLTHHLGNCLGLLVVSVIGGVCDYQGAQGSFCVSLIFAFCSADAGL